MTEEQLINLFKEKGLEKAKEKVSYISTEDGFLYEIITNEYEKFMPDGFEFAQDNTVEYHDSYGYEDSDLEIIVKHIDSGRYLSIYGTRQSYNGTEVKGVKEVKPKQVVKIIFE